MDADDGPETPATTALQAIAFGLLMQALPMSPQAVRTSLAEAWVGLGDWTLSLWRALVLTGLS